MYVVSNMRGQEASSECLLLEYLFVHLQTQNMLIESVESTEIQARNSIKVRRYVAINCVLLGLIVCGLWMLLCWGCA